MSYASLHHQPTNEDHNIFIFEPLFKKNKDVIASYIMIVLSDFDRYTASFLKEQFETIKQDQLRVHKKIITGYLTSILGYDRVILDQACDDLDRLYAPFADKIHLLNNEKVEELNQLNQLFFNDMRHLKRNTEHYYQKSAEYIHLKNLIQESYVKDLNHFFVQVEEALDALKKKYSHQCIKQSQYNELYECYKKQLEDKDTTIIYDFDYLEKKIDHHRKMQKKFASN